MLWAVLRDGRGAGKGVSHRLKEGGAPAESAGLRGLRLLHGDTRAVCETRDSAEARREQIGEGALLLGCRRRYHKRMC